jgi:hypothetical protein
VLETGIGPALENGPGGIVVELSCNKTATCSSVNGKVKRLTELFICENGEEFGW